ncbi:MAG: A24 family peptidase [Acidobacteriota bacterium]|nr:A24 family peptidase [Acidobacteriota bacterium]
MITPLQQLIPMGGALLCAVVGSIHDLRDRRIPNWITGPAILGGLLLHGVTGHWSGLGESVLAGVIAGAVALVFWFAGGMGAGDVKLMAAVGCIAGLFDLHLLLFSIALAGGICGLALAVYHGRLRPTLSSAGSLLRHHLNHGLAPHPELNLNNPGTLRLPFALPIAAGCLATLCSLVSGVSL